MSVEIKYNYSNPFSGLPTPFVERTVEYIGDNATQEAIETVVLSGEIPAGENCDGFTYLIGKQQDILNSFSQSFRPLEIKEDGVSILKHENVKVESISFDESGYTRLLPYTIKLSLYRSDFLKHDGVEKVSDSLDFSEGEDGTLQITHTVQATGVAGSEDLSSSSRLEKAKAFVQANSGKDKIDIHPVFISHKGMSDSGSPVPTPTPGDLLVQINPILTGFNENINRLTGTYGITKNYICDIYYESEGILRYTVNVGRAPESFTTVEIGGSLRYEEDAPPPTPTSTQGVNLEKLEARFRAFQFYTVAKEVSGEGGLNSTPLKHSVSKGSGQNAIDFEIAYDTNPDFTNTGSTREEISFSFENDSDFITIDLSGAIKARLGARNKWEMAKNSFDSLNIFSIAEAKYEDYVLNVLGLTNTQLLEMPLNSNESSSSQSFVKSLGEINFNYKFDNFPILADNTIFRNFEYTIDVKNAVEALVSAPRVAGNRLYTVQDLNSSDRGTITISGTALKKREIGSASAISAIHSACYSRISGYSLATALQINVTCNGVNSFSFTFSYSLGGGYLSGTTVAL
jgi:hypothetical protein